MSDSDTNPPTDESRSGLKNPPAAARGLATAALILESISLLLGMAPMNMVLPDPTWALVILGALALGCLVLLGFSRHGWIWPAGMGLQVVLVASWTVHPALGIAGVISAAVWGYCWKVRNELLRPPRRPQVDVPSRRRSRVPGQDD
ncbi:DUF4233 domain-containing protein [Haloglycomyces albus]|uniref:DUF4233 domain-containing protein n=1 Tax=Haloglycomyces albus TaxID=526067 RepID=UPI00046CCE68|nr:DUF4233 domain-containing protein [Haloglycomyces albus]